MLRHDRGFPRLYNKDQKGGYRDERECNRNLKLGPDMGGGVTGGLYLPAHERYTGRFFSALLRENPDFWKNLPNSSLEILFVSGLYGLVFWDELIQEYDCHFQDVRENGKEKKLGKIWSLKPTDLLCEVTNKCQGQAVKVFDLSSEEAYQEIFDWKKVYSSGATFYHRVFRNFVGPDILQLLAVILAQEFPRFLAGPAFRCGEWYPLRVEESTPEYGFEFPIGSMGDAAREGETRSTLKRIRNEFPTLKDLPDDILQQFVIAEHSWEIVKGNHQFAFGAMVVSFSTSVEAYFQWVEPEWTGKDRRHLTLGAIAWYLEDSVRWHPLYKNVSELNQLRRAGAHAGNACGSPDAERARTLAREIIVNAEKIRLKIM